AISVAAVILSVCFSAWLSVYSQLSFAGYTTVNRMESRAFDLSGVAPLGAILPLSSVRYPAFFRPRTASGSYATASPVRPGGYILRFTYSNAAGRQVGFDTLYHACARPAGHGQSTIAVSCLIAHGFRITESFQPASRYWPLQTVTAGILAVAAAAMLAFAV